MDLLLNPFRPGAGTPPPILAGRERELEAFATLIGRLERGRGERSMVLTGLRGVGKTVLLAEYERRATESGWAAVSIEVRPGLDFRDAIADGSWTALRELGRRRIAKAVRAALTRASELVRSFRLAVSEPESGVEVSVAVDLPAGASGELETDLTELFRGLGEAAEQAGTGIVFLIDEMQLLRGPALEALCSALHDLGKRAQPIALVAAGLPPLRDQLLAAKTYAERLFNYVHIGPLDPEAAAAALTEPARTALPEGPEVTFAAPALARLLEAAAGYPYFIQVYGHAAWEFAEGPEIGDDDASRAVEEGREALDADLYAGRWRRATDRGRRYMRAMAELGSGPIRTRAVAERGGFETAQRASPVRDQLISQGLVFSPSRGTVEFSIPGFDDYIRRAAA